LIENLITTDQDFEDFIPVYTTFFKGMMTADGRYFFQSGSSKTSERSVGSRRVTALIPNMTKLMAQPIKTTTSEKDVELLIAQSPT
jgi:hypothetical protein